MAENIPKFFNPIKVRRICRSLHTRHPLILQKVVNEGSSMGTRNVAHENERRPNCWTYSPTSRDGEPVARMPHRWHTTQYFGHATDQNGNFDPQFLLSFGDVKPYLGFIFLRAPKPNRHSRIFYMPHNRATETLTIFSIMKIHRLGPGTNLQPQTYKVNDKPTTPSCRHIIAA
ncbi:hypothetical protein TNCV_1175791 [Trichonephila clavipes]|nr:hypothetical protein TNCV_1175791 [Trichonephila clavipes]